MVIINPAHRLLKLFFPLLDMNPRDMKLANYCSDNITRCVLYKCPKSSCQSRKLAFLWLSVTSNFRVLSCSVPLMPLLLRFTTIVVHNSSKQSQLAFWLGSISIWLQHYSDTTAIRYYLSFGSNKNVIVFNVIQIVSSSSRYCCRGTQDVNSDT